MHESLSKLISISNIVEKETNKAVLSTENALIIKAAYEEIAKIRLNTHCDSCWSFAIRICRNWLAENKVDEVLNERVLHPVKDDAIVEETPKPKRKRKSKNG